MTRQPIYLDHHATTPLLDDAKQAMAAAFDHVGNPSSIHSAGRAAKALVDQARAQVLGLVSGCAGRLVFTSGGTEANNLAIRGGAAGNHAVRLIVGPTEHDAVAAVVKTSDLPVTILPCDQDGIVDLQALEAALAAGEGRALVSIMAVNNEVGTIQPIDKVSALCQAHDALLHVDAIQATGKVELTPLAFAADFLSLAAHKIGGPMGVGALHIRNGIELTQIQHGGGQEQGARGGSENLLGIVGFGAAATQVAASIDDQPRLLALQQGLEAQLVAAGGIIVGAGAPRVATCTAVVMPGVKAETQLMNFDLEGICVSSGSACSSGKVGTSTTLAAMGLATEQAKCVIRISMGWTTTQDDIDRFVEVWRTINDRLGTASSAA